MGQYHIIVNLDKKQYLHPHCFGDGLKLLEFGSSGDGTMCGLAILLVNSNNRGGGDLRSYDPIIGSWAGDRIVIAGDYGDPIEPGFDPNSARTLYKIAHDEFTDISEKVLVALCDDPYLKKALAESIQRFHSGLQAETRNRVLRDDPPHVKLAQYVLRHPDEPDVWQPLVTALTEQYFGGQVPADPVKEAAHDLLAACKLATKLVLSERSPIPVHGTGLATTLLAAINKAGDTTFKETPNDH